MNNIIALVNSLPTTFNADLYKFDEQDFKLTAINLNSIVSIRPYDENDRFCVFNCASEHIIVLGSVEDNLKLLFNYDR